MLSDMKNTIRHLIAAFFMLSAVATAFAQEKILTGTVLEDTGNGVMPVIGAGIVVKGTQNGTVSDENGQFSLTASPEDVLVVVDEELVDYIGQGYRDIYELILTSPNLIVLRSFSHAYGLASLRIGYMLSCEEISGIINVLRDPFNVSQLALDCATAALDDVSFFNKVIHANDVERNRFREFCAYYGLTMINTKSCSVTIDFGEQAERYYNAFLQLGIFTRPLSYLGLRSLINISIGHPKATDFLLAKLEKLILSDAQQSRLD